MWRKKLVQDYLHFNRKDRIGLLVLIALIAVIYFLPYLAEKEESFPLEEGTRLAFLTDSITAQANEQVAEKGSRNLYNYGKGEEEKPRNTRLFRFDPNTLTPDGWKDLGLPDRVIKILTNYRNKGGRFNHPEDLKKIWGLPEGFFERVKDSILLASSAPLEKGTSNHFTEKKPPLIRSVSLNTADTTLLIALPGIGSKLAARLISFRDKLGGFYNVEQVGELYGLPDSTFRKIRPWLHVDGPVKQIHINLAKKDELKSHPYIRWALANAIVEYRNQHGSFHSLDDLKNIPLITDSLFQKINPYLTIE